MKKEIVLKLNTEALKKLRHEAADADFDSVQEYIENSLLHNTNKIIPVEQPVKDVAERFVDLLSEMSAQDLAVAKKILNDPSVLEQLGVGTPGPEEEKVSTVDDNSFVRTEDEEVDSDELVEYESPIIVPSKEEVEQYAPEFDIEPDESLEDAAADIVDGQLNTGEVKEFEEKPNGYIGNKMYERAVGNDDIENVDTYSSTYEENETEQSRKDAEFNKKSAEAIAMQLKVKGKYVKPKKPRILNYDPEKSSNVHFGAGKYVNAPRTPYKDPKVATLSDASRFQQMLGD